MAPLVAGSLVAGSLLAGAAVALGLAQERSPSTGEVAVHFLTKDVAVVDYWPCFSPDGRSVLFSRSVDGKKTWDLFIVPVAGGTARRLAPFPLPVSATRAHWSLRSNEVAFTGVSDDGTTSVWIIGADGTDPRRVAAAGLSERVLYPSWYPGGDLAVMDPRDEAIKRIDRKKGVAIPVTDHAQVLTGMPSVSPDGRWLAFAGQRNTGRPYDQTKNSIWLVDDAGIHRTVEAIPGQGRAPSWSPDGEWLAFQSNRGSSSQRHAAFVVKRDGTGLAQVTDVELDANHPVWSPDARRLAFSARVLAQGEATGIAIIELPRLR